MRDVPPICSQSLLVFADTINSVAISADGSTCVSSGSCDETVRCAYAYGKQAFARGMTCCAALAACDADGRPLSCTIYVYCALINVRQKPACSGHNGHRA